MSARFWASVLPLSPAVRCLILTPWAAQPLSTSAGPMRQNTVSAMSRRLFCSTWQERKRPSMNAFLRMRLEPAAALLAVALLSGPALAEESGRFVLKEADQNTFVRLDTFTGAI